MSLLSDALGNVLALKFVILLVQELLSLAFIQLWSRDSLLHLSILNDLFDMFLGVDILLLLLLVCQLVMLLQHP